MVSNRDPTACPECRHVVHRPGECLSEGCNCGQVQPATEAPHVVITPEQIDGGVDLIHRTALGVGKILLLEHGDVPRLLVSAGCRSLEQLIEFYDKSKEKQDVTGRARLQLQIRTLADNLHGALEEALSMVTSVRASLTPEGGE